MERINGINGNETVGGFWQPWTNKDSEPPIARWQSVITYVGNVSVENTHSPPPGLHYEVCQREHDHAVMNSSKKTSFVAQIKPHKNQKNNLIKKCARAMPDIKIISTLAVTPHNNDMFVEKPESATHKILNKIMAVDDMFTPYLDWQRCANERMDILKEMLCAGTDSFNNEYIRSGFADAVYAGDADKIRYCFTLLPGLQRGDVLKQAIELAAIMGYKNAINVLFEFSQCFLCTTFILAALEQTLRWQRYELSLLLHQTLKKINGFNNIEMNISIPVGLKHLEPLPSRILPSNGELKRYRLFQSLHLLLWKHNGNIFQAARESHLSRHTLLSQISVCGIAQKMYKIDKIFLVVSQLSNTMVSPFYRP
ncbi:hypothetical protein SJI19_12575 [Acerihabitans sp. TG2]|uniref:hypothetical protein n=1 Tax=Acerihabitans sp. TG2 TaxID=3096008 RepID=UPI002B221D04|nr:hypothetical protein [Acerihabitans sp. TG2]MEA9391367.1 hypothetical protein [Acerihabitans sp. TG2]